MVCKIFFAPNLPIFRKSLNEERKKVANLMQNVVLYKPTKKTPKKNIVIKFLY